MVLRKENGFVLRPYRKGDGPSLVHHIHDKDIAKNTLAIPYPYTLKDAKQWIARCIKESKRKKPESVVFAITVDDKVVGGIGLDKIEPQHKAELGYWLGRQYWGKGMMTAAVRLVMKYGFQQLKLRRIYACVFPFNKASARVLEKVGFRYEGLLRSNVLKHGKPYDDLLYALIRK